MVFFKQANKIASLFYRALKTSLGQIGLGLLLYIPYPRKLWLSITIWLIKLNFFLIFLCYFFVGMCVNLKIMELKTNTWLISNIRNRMPLALVSPGWLIILQVHFRFSLINGFSWLNISVKKLTSSLQTSLFTKVFFSPNIKLKIQLNNVAVLI